MKELEGEGVTGEGEGGGGSLPDDLQDVADSGLLLRDVEPVGTGAGHEMLLAVVVGHKLTRTGRKSTKH